ncbi:MAG: glycosyltransferase family 39 protein [Thermoleophilaceae bacterium]|nr:glycosyltransferase family 39 protein [Thermoleophilaceae bacterium]
MSLRPAAKRSRISSAATALAGGVDRRAGLLLIAILSALGAITVLLADRKPLWNDELFTYYIGRLPGAGDVWSKLATGVEQTPLFFYLVTRASFAIFGHGQVAIRVPEMLGYMLMSVCLFRFVARRSSPIYGLVAALFPVATIAHGYAYEARAYALVLGFSAAALLCWQLATEGGPHRRLAALGLAVSLAAAVGSHYYAALVLIPLLAGEAARSLARRRVDWLVVGSLSGALLPLLLFAPLVREAGEYTTTFWALPTWPSAVRFYPNSLLDRELPAVVGVVLAVAALAALRSSSGPSVRERALRRPPDHELLMLLTLVLLPFFGVALGKLVTGAFTERSVLPAVLGITILIALAAWWTDREAPIVALSLLLVLTMFAGVRLAMRYDDAKADAEQQTQALHFLEGHSEGGVPIAVASPHDFFELSHLAVRDGGPRLVYLADAALAVRYLETDAVDLGVVGLQDIAPLHVEPYRSFVASHPRFLVYAGHGAWDWLTSALDSSGANTRVFARNRRNGDVLFEVKRRR